MRHKKWIIMTALLTLTVAAESSAGWFGLKKDKETREPQIHRFTGTPRRTLLVGRLTEVGRGRWQLDDADLHLLPGCRLEVQGQAVQHLVRAERALVLGTRYGDTVVARQVRVYSLPTEDSTPLRDRYRIEWSEANPAVGVGQVEGVE